MIGIFQRSPAWWSPILSRPGSSEGHEESGSGPAGLKRAWSSMNGLHLFLKGMRNQLLQKQKQVQQPLPLPAFSQIFSPYIYRTCHRLNLRPHCGKSMALSQDCWAACGSKSGYCPTFCGIGACWVPSGQEMADFEIAWKISCGKNNNKHDLT